MDIRLRCVLGMWICGAGVATAQPCTPIVLDDETSVAPEAFGAAVAASSDLIVVGAPSNDAIALNAGCVHVYRRVLGEWTHEATLLANDGASGDLFGLSVAVSGSTIVIGAPDDDIGTYSNQGSAYVFEYANGAWTQAAKLTFDGQSSEEFGCAVAIDGDTIVVGARRDDPSGHTSRGSAFVFSRAGSNWTQSAHLVASNGAASDFFGHAVAMSASTIVVTANLHDVGGITNMGAAFVFERQGEVWPQIARLSPADGANEDHFGVSVAIDGDSIVVGSPHDDHGAVLNAGSAYVYVRANGIWAQQAKLVAVDAAEGDNLGDHVAIRGDIVLAGVYADDVEGTLDQGSVRAYSREGGLWTAWSNPIVAPDGTASDIFGVAATINDEEIVVGATGYPTGRLASRGAVFVFEIEGACPSSCDGDVNCDFALDGFDVETMEKAVGGDMTDFCQDDPDFNGDFALDGFDVEAVELVVSGGPCP